MFFYLLAGRGLPRLLRLDVGLENGELFIDIGNILLDNKRKLLRKAVSELERPFGGGPTEISTGRSSNSVFRFATRLVYQP